MSSKTLYSYSDIAKIIGKSKTYVSNFISKHVRKNDIEINKIYTIPNNNVYIDSESLERIKEKINQIRIKKLNSKSKRTEKMYWKVSVFDDKVGYFIVKKCSLTKREAVVLRNKYLLQKKRARISPHIRQTIIQYSLLK